MIPASWTERKVLICSPEPESNFTTVCAYDLSARATLYSFLFCMAFSVRRILFWARLQAVAIGSSELLVACWWLAVPAVLCWQCTEYAVSHIINT
jgi:hypothetical protein